LESFDPLGSLVELLFGFGQADNEFLAFEVVVVDFEDSKPEDEAAGYQSC
jgi:hypothetical protein